MTRVDHLAWPKGLSLRQVGLIPKKAGLSIAASQVLATSIIAINYFSALENDIRNNINSINLGQPRQIT